jgi:hypothetical protein
MIRLLSRAPAARPVRARRVVLRLEDFERRDTPTVGSGIGIGSISAVGDPTSWDQVSRVSNCPPEIVDFAAAPAENGCFLISGRVIDEHPAGLTVSFGGDVATLYGQTTMTDENGCFSVLVYLNPNGTDTGWLTAVTQDDAGQSSNVAKVYVNP